MESLEAFRLFLRRDKGQEPSTVFSNMKLIRRLLRECSPFNYETVSAFISKLLDLDRDVGYINQYIVVLHYYAEAFDLKELLTYPFCKQKQRDDYIPAIMEDKEVEAFLHIPNPYPKGGFYYKRHDMWTIFWSICAYHGNRPGEAAKLRKTPTAKEISHIDFGRSMIIFVGKNGSREVPLSFVIKDEVQHYVEHLEGDYLFPSVHNPKCPHVKDNGWENDFEKRMKNLESQFPGISSRLNLDPYSLRHSAGTRWMEENWSMSKIQTALGHKKLTTTQKYIHVSKKAVAEMINNDRIAIKHKSGTEILKNFIAMISDFEKMYADKIFMNIEKTENGQEAILKIKVRN